MTRVARVVAPGVPHHITQRGNRRQTTFFCEADYRLYKNLMAEWCRRYQVKIWAHCLMPNHIHLIAVPPDGDCLRRAIGEAHKRYSLVINKRQKWTGHLWQGRFFSYPMDDQHLLMAARYIERNPVRKGLVKRPEEYLWSSARAHLQGAADMLADPSPLLQMVKDWREFISLDIERGALEEIRLHQRTGRPLGKDDFVLRMEKETGRSLRPQKRGRKPKDEIQQIKKVGVPEFPELCLFK